MIHLCPFKILSFRLDLPLSFRIPNTFHVSLLEHYHHTSISGQNQPVEIDGERSLKLNLFMMPSTLASCFAWVED